MPNLEEKNYVEYLPEKYKIPAIINMLEKQPEYLMDYKNHLYEVLNDPQLLLISYLKMSGLDTDEMRGDIFTERVEKLKDFKNSIILEKYHKRSISQIQTGSKKGKWKTYVYTDGKRKEIIRNTEQEIRSALVEFYEEQKKNGTSFSEAFDMLLIDKKNRGRDGQTLIEDKRMFNYIEDKIKNMPINTITEETLRAWIVNSFLSEKKTLRALKKQLLLLRQIFEYGKEKKLCYENPAEYIKYKDYTNACMINKKSDEMRSFSEKEVSLLREDALRNLNNPNNILMLLAMVTGMRAGELVAVKVNDVDSEYIHVHRQQKRSRDNGSQEFYDVEYTKNERENPKNGRYIPITPEIREVLHYAEQLSGDSDYLIHDNGKEIYKDTYEQFLRRKCARLGISTSNNHAFRVRYNAILISLGLDDIERAYILGHSPQVNGKYYSPSDNRRLESIKRKMLEE